jgi:two-component system, LytTR family, sensor kinase
MEKVSSELKFLKAQINPHFLFNTLNNIYALARKKSEDTPEVVLKLSNMLRYMLYETKAEKVTVEKEIQLIEDYIQIEKIRYSNRLNISFNKEIDDSKTLIAPLILLPFVENAFKHGASESRFDINIAISLQLVDNQIKFTVINTKEAHCAAIKDSIGLGNIKRQLELTYKTHNLQIENTENHFKVTLIIYL